MKMQWKILLFGLILIFGYACKKSDAGPDTRTVQEKLIAHKWRADSSRYQAVGQLSELTIIQNPVYVVFNDSTYTWSTTGFSQRIFYEFQPPDMLFFDGPDPLIVKEVSDQRLHTFKRSSYNGATIDEYFHAE